MYMYMYIHVHGAVPSDAFGPDHSGKVFLEWNSGDASIALTCDSRYEFCVIYGLFCGMDVPQFSIT